MLNLERETRLELARLPAQQLPAQPDLGKVALYQLSHSFCARISGTKKPSHGRFFAESGAGNETRTRDPDLGKVVLYQLSYSRKTDAESGVP